MSVCRSLPLSAFFFSVNRFALMRFLNLRCSGVGGGFVRLLFRVGGAVVVAAIGVVAALSRCTSLSHFFLSLASVCSASQSPLIGASMHKSPGVGEL